MVLKIKNSMSLRAALTLASHFRPLSRWPRSPATRLRSRILAPKRGVKPPGKRSLKEKELAAVLIDEGLDLVEGGVQGGHVHRRGVNVVFEVEIGDRTLRADAKDAAARRGGTRSAEEKPPSVRRLPSRQSHKPRPRRRGRRRR